MKTKILLVGMLGLVMSGVVSAAGVCQLNLNLNGNRNGEDAYTYVTKVLGVPAEGEIVVSAHYLDNKKQKVVCSNITITTPTSGSSPKKLKIVCPTISVSELKQAKYSIGSVPLGSEMQYVQIKYNGVCKAKYLFTQPLCESGGINITFPSSGDAWHHCKKN